MRSEKEEGKRGKGKKTWKGKREWKEMVWVVGVLFVVPLFAVREQQESVERIARANAKSNVRGEGSTFRCTLVREDWSDF